MNNYYNSKRLDTKRYPEFQKQLITTIGEKIFQSLPENIAKVVLKKIDKEPNFEFNQEAFLHIYQDYIISKVKEILYFDDELVAENIGIAIITHLGAEQSFILFQFVMAYISLHT